MSPSVEACVIVALIFSSMGVPTAAQTTQFVPEINDNLKLSSFMRAYVQAKDDRNQGQSGQFSLGPSMRFYFKPLLKLKKFAIFDLDDSKSRALVFEMGYRYLSAPNTSSTNRMETMVTFNFPLKTGFLISDRNRADLDWKNGSFSWRYRNKLSLERAIAVHSYHPIPYVAAEPYYVDKYHKWSTTALYVGSLFPVGKHVQFNAYYEHENNTGTKSNLVKNDFGLSVSFFASIARDED
jgi:hypothetical protein